MTQIQGGESREHRARTESSSHDKRECPGQKSEMLVWEDGVKGIGYEAKQGMGVA